MSEHLPECGAIDCDCTPEEECVSSCRNNCICDRLRQAEQRALGKARDAVAALPAYYAIEECQGNPLEKGDPEDPDPWKQGHLIERDDALAAIDALRGES